MKTLAIVSQKGGSGKTTIAVHLAICAQRHGLRPALIDLDPQSSAFGWNGSRPKDHQLDAVKSSPEHIRDLISRAKRAGVTLAIVDTAPHSNAGAAMVARECDLMLIPCRPARFDLDAIASTVGIAKAAKVPCAVILNAAPRGRLAEEARAALTRQGINVLAPVLHQRAAYSHAVIDGRSVHEYEPRGQAAAEVDALYDHVTKLLGHKKRKAA